MGKWSQADSSVNVGDKFDDLIQMWLAWCQNRSSNKDLLKFKIDRMCEALSAEDRAELTRVLIDRGYLDPGVVDAIRMTNGIIYRLT